VHPVSVHGIRESRRGLKLFAARRPCGRFAIDASTGAIGVASALNVEGMPVQTGRGAMRRYQRSIQRTVSRKINAFDDSHMVTLTVSWHLSV
jgi:hypothetical protein